MQKPKLIISLTSPYARKVRITALENKIDFDEVVDVPWNEDTKVINFNPLGKVPVWLTTNEQPIYDSRVIVEYLEELTGKNHSSINGLQQIEIKLIEALADGVMDASLCLFAERKKRPKELQHQWWIDRQFSKVHRGLEKLNTAILNKKYFCLDRLTVADFTVIGALGYVQLRFSEDFDWQQKYPELAKFYQQMMQRPSCSTTVPVI